MPIHTSGTAQTQPAAPVADADCAIPGCDGTWHWDGTCVAPLGEIAFDGVDSALPVELVDEDGTRSIVAFAFDMDALNLRREMRDQGAARDFAAQLRRIADAVDAASVHLPAA